jgi:hypothetical protein
MGLGLGSILHTDAYGAAPGATGIAYSNDGGQTWHEDTNYGPLDPSACQGECVNGEDGVIGANGTYFVAVKYGGKQAWLSYDGQHWSSIAWTGGDPTGAWRRTRTGPRARCSSQHGIHHSASDETRPSYSNPGYSSSTA